MTLCVCVCVRVCVWVCVCVGVSVTVFLFVPFFFFFFCNTTFRVTPLEDDAVGQENGDHNGVGDGGGVWWWLEGAWGGTWELITGWRNSTTRQILESSTSGIKYLG